MAWSAPLGAVVVRKETVYREFPRAVTRNARPSDQPEWAGTHTEVVPEISWLSRTKPSSDPISAPGRNHRLTPFPPHDDRGCRGTFLSSLH